VLSLLLPHTSLSLSLHLIRLLPVRINISFSLLIDRDTQSLFTLFITAGQMAGVTCFSNNLKVNAHPYYPVKTVITSVNQLIS
jgi:hypothetical protein